MAASQCTTSKDMDADSILAASEINEVRYLPALFVLMSTDTLHSHFSLFQRLAARPLWKLSDGHLVRQFTSKNFKSAMSFLNLAGEVAESAGHHPDLHLTAYRNVEVPVRKLNDFSLLIAQ